MLSISFDLYILNCSAFSYWVEFCVYSEYVFLVEFLCHEHCYSWVTVGFWDRSSIARPGLAGTCFTGWLYPASAWDYNTPSHVQLLMVFLNGSGNVSYVLAFSFYLGEKKNLLSFYFCKVSPISVPAVLECRCEASVDTHSGVLTPGEFQFSLNGTDSSLKNVNQSVT